jgi:hypothetical protein
VRCLRRFKCEAFSSRTSKSSQNSSVSSSFPGSEPTPHFKAYDMGDQSGSTRFRVLFESALQAYEKQTGITLAEHPLTLQLQSCRSIGSITTLLQDQIPGSSDSGGNDRVMTSIKSTISLLSTLSTTTAFDWAIGMVRQVLTCSTSLTFFCRHSPLKMRFTLASLSYLLYVPFLTSYVHILLTSR